MLFLTQALQIINSREEFSIKYVALGNKKRKRDGGYIVDIPRAVVSSSFFAGHTINIECVPSGNIREVKAILIIELNGQEVFY